MEKLFRDQLILVTGASGFIGSHVAAQLVALGAKVRGLSRTPPQLPSEIEWHQADITDPASLVAPFQDCRYVFHVAGDYRFWAPNPHEIVRNNVDGTRNVLDIVKTVGVEKIIVTGTQGVLAPGTLENPGDETRLVPHTGLHGPYKTSKFLAHQLVARAIAEGAPIINVLPGAPIGANDPRPTPTGAIIVNFLNGKIPLLARTGLSFVDVADVARGHLLALKKGAIGQSYLLAGENLWLEQFLTLLIPYSHHKVPRHHAPFWLSYLAATFSEAYYSWASSYLGGKEITDPFITRESVRMSRHPYFFSSAKAIRELGYTLSPLPDALARAVQDFARRQLVPPLP